MISRGLDAGRLSPDFLKLCTEVAEIKAETSEPVVKSVDSMFGYITRWSRRVDLLVPLNKLTQYTA